MAFTRFAPQILKLSTVHSSSYIGETSPCNDSLQREAQPVHERLAREKKGLETQRRHFICLKGREDEVRLAVADLQAQVEFEKRDFEIWSYQIRGQRMIAIPWHASVRTSRAMIYQTTFKRLAALLEEARIARHGEKAAISALVELNVVRDAGVPAGVCGTSAGRASQWVRDAR
jgi:hypothetical protein